MTELDAAEKVADHILGRALPPDHAAAARLSP